MIEKELKVLLDKHTYKKVLNLFCWDNIITHHNYYFSDEDYMLEKNKISVRVRKKDDNLKLQIKIPIKNKMALHIKDEYEESIKQIPEVISSEKIKSITGKNIKNAYRIGTLITERYIAWYTDSIRICLDKNIYLKTIDYELEIEYINDIDDTLINLLISNGISFKCDANGKYSRFLNLYKAISEANSD